MPHNKEIEEMFKKWNIHQIGCDFNRKRVFGNNVCDMNCKNVFDSVITAITHYGKSQYDKGVEETEKAFGGCKRCYGKGYSTVLDKTTYHADFIGDKTYTEDNNPMKYCSCGRGEQLKSLNK